MATQYLRDVLESDLAVFYAQQMDQDAALMAAFPSRDEDTFMSHWKNKVLRDTSAVNRAIVVHKSIAGHILSWNRSGKQLVGYWLGKEYWGRSIATCALQEFLSILKTRPLFAHVAKHNVGSIKVLEKCGFVISDYATVFSGVHGHEIEEITFVLN